MNVNVTLFYDTKFDAANIPDSPALLAQFYSKVFSSIFVKQDRELVNIKIEATWNEVKNADYVELYSAEPVSRQYYFIVGINMINDRTAMLSLLEDTITSVGGVGALNFIDGWATRLSVGSDELFENVIEETFQPSEPLIIEDYIFLGEKPEDDNESVEVVCSTVQLDNILPIAVTYSDANGEGAVTVPQMPKVATKTVYRLVDEDNNEIFEGKVSGMNTYNYEVQSVQDGITNARSLGIENSIVASYQIPTTYTSLTDGVGYVLAMKSQLKVEENTIPVKFQIPEYTPKNNKVYAVMSSITLKNIASQNSIEYRPWEIARPLPGYDSNNIEFCTWADLSPSGKPYCRPLKYMGFSFEGEPVNKNYSHMFDTGICGANWRNLPITFNEVSAQASIQAQMHLEAAQMSYQQAGLDVFGNSLRNDKALAMLDIDTTRWGLSTAVKSVSDGTFTNPVSLMNTTLGAVGKGVEYYYDKAGINNAIAKNDLQARQAYNKIRSEMFQYEMQAKITVPKQVFPYSFSMVDWIGNGFIAYRTRCSNKDIQRFDEYLTKFGYSVSEPLTKEKLFTRTNFNFVQANSVFLDDANEEVTNRRQEAIQSLFTAGVRIWHVKPSHDKLINNPIKEVN